LSFRFPTSVLPAHFSGISITFDAIAEAVTRTSRSGIHLRELQPVEGGQWLDGNTRLHERYVLVLRQLVILHHGLGDVIFSFGE
jgi:hypothetical protein